MGSCRWSWVLAMIVAVTSMPMAHAHGTHSQLMAMVDRKIQEDPGNGEWWCQRAWLNLEHEDWQQTLLDLEKAESLAPGKFPTLWFKGEALELAGRLQEAKSALDEFIVRFPKDARGFPSRARVLMKLGMKDAALSDYRSALVQSPETGPDLVQEAADALAANGCEDEALRVLDSGLKRLGRIPSLLTRALEIEMRNGRVDSALTRVEAMRNSAPRPEPWMAKRALLLSGAGRIGESREAWKSLITHLESLPNLERGSNSMSLLAEQARIEMAALDRPDRRVLPIKPGSVHEEELQRANEQITASPAESKSWYQRALLLLADGEFQQALLDCDETDRLKPDELATGYVRGQALAGLGDLEKGRAVLDSFIGKFSEHVRARAARARVLIALKQPDLALEDYRHALRLSAEMPDLELIQEAVLAFDSYGHRDEAIKTLDAGLASMGDDPSLLLRALEMETTAGKFDAAISRVDSLAKSAPKQEPWMAKRAELLARAGRTAEARAAWQALLAHLDGLPNLERGLPAMTNLVARAKAALSSPDSIPPTASATTPILLQ